MILRRAIFLRDLEKLYAEYEIAGKLKDDVSIMLKAFTNRYIFSITGCGNG